MKIATAFYDYNGGLLPLGKRWEEIHETSTVLTMDGGYWHSCIKFFNDQATRDIMAEAINQAIMDNNGSVYSDDYSTGPVIDDGENLGWTYTVVYVIEEPHQEPYYRYAATVNSNGPDWLDLYNSRPDPIAEFGPDYIEESSGNGVYMYAHSVDKLINAKTRALVHQRKAEAEMAAVAQLQAQTAAQMQQMAAAAPAEPAAPKARITRRLTGDKARAFVAQNPDMF